MSGSRFGRFFCVQTFGESHGPSVGTVIDGCPAGIKISRREIQRALDRRRPGQSTLTTSRQEPDEFQILSGCTTVDNDVFVTTGTPISLVVANVDVRPGDYVQRGGTYRPSHADFTYSKKYKQGLASGGGRASARETVGRVLAGSIAQQLLESVYPGLHIVAYVDQVAALKWGQSPSLLSLSRDVVDSSLVRCPDLSVSAQMIKIIERAKEEGDSVGGVIRCWVFRRVATSDGSRVVSLPVGWGDPVFDKIEADLAKAMLSLPASKSFMLGDDVMEWRGSQSNDPFVPQDKIIGSDGELYLSAPTSTNHSGGIQGGLSNGSPIHFRAGFKPVSTLQIAQKTVDDSGNDQTLAPMGGRHDPCVLPRAVVIVEAMTAIVLADHFLRDRVAVI